MPSTSRPRPLLLFHPVLQRGRPSLLLICMMLVPDARCFCCGYSVFWFSLGFSLSKASGFSPLYPVSQISSLEPPKKTKNSKDSPALLLLLPPLQSFSRLYPSPTWLPSKCTASAWNFLSAGLCATESVVIPASAAAA